MGIHYGLDINREMHTAGYAMVLFMFLTTQLDTLYNLKTSHEVIFKLRIRNVTSNETNLYCDIPYDDCRCSVVSVKYCLTDARLKFSRIVPIVLFVLQICLAQELFSLSGDHKHLLICALWITSIFVLIGIVALIYRSSCCHGYTLGILYLTGFLVVGFFGYAFLAENERRWPSGRNNFVMDGQRFQMTDGEALV
ncbi:unnamed protein product [Adineta steineri]|uniref:Uncharacterized protein n=1 Tax=Adineta steineri TaxID=433720 RepID=A0A815L0P7_9BILA|nr:unnamed protein product [Adineta steineri]CAF1399916.1 unnamed protein product [Adineta steineri]